MVEITLNVLIQILKRLNIKYGDIPVFIGTDHGSDVSNMTPDDYDLVDEAADGCSDPLKPHLIIGKDVSRE